jgi:hypothetical protein
MENNPSPKTRLYFCRMRWKMDLKKNPVENLWIMDFLYIFLIDVIDLKCQIIG